jgi:hypothetical protein
MKKKLGRPPKDMAALRALARHGFKSAHEVKAALGREAIRASVNKIEQQKELDGPDGPEPGSRYHCLPQVSYAHRIQGRCQVANMPSYDEEAAKEVGHG